MTTDRRTDRLFSKNIIVDKYGRKSTNFVHKYINVYELALGAAAPTDFRNMLIFTPFLCEY